MRRTIATRQKRQLNLRVNDALGDSSWRNRLWYLIIIIKKGEKKVINNFINYLKIIIKISKFII